MEDRSSFPGCGSGEADGLRVTCSEVGPKCLSSRCPCRLRSTQLQRAHARTLSLHSQNTSKYSVLMLLIGRKTPPIWMKNLHRCAGRGCSNTRHVFSSRKGFRLPLRGDKLLCRGIVISYKQREKRFIEEKSKHSTSRTTNKGKNVCIRMKLSQNT